MRQITDNPSGWNRVLPIHAVEYEASFAQPFSVNGSLVLAAGANSTYHLDFVDTEHIYFIDMITVTPQAFVDFAAIVGIGLYIHETACGRGSVTFALRQNPSLQFLADDKLGVVVYNLDTVRRTFIVTINGTKIKKPANFGHVVGAYFTIDDYSIAAGEHVHFTDGSYYNPISWDWDFKDGSPHSYEQHPTHTYAVAGSYYPKLKAKNAYGYDYYCKSVPIVVS